MMRVLQLLIALAAAGSGAVTGVTFASDLRIAPPTKESGGCDLYVAGFDSKEPFLHFFEQLKSASEKKDEAVLSRMILYPLRVNRPGSRAQMIRNPAEFRKAFDRLFSRRIQDVIAKQQLDRLFCRDQGVMYGNGELWVGTVRGRVGIQAMNLPTTQAE